MEELEWAESSSMASWPGIRNIEFEGKQVFYWTDLYASNGFDPKYIPPKVYGASDVLDGEYELIINLK